MTGSSYERELVGRLERARFAVMRAPSSGSATERELPDIRAIRDGYNEPYSWAIEAKANSRPLIYLDATEIDKLRTFAALGGHEVLLAGRWKQDHDTGWNQHNDAFDAKAWYLYHPDDVHRTGENGDGGNYRLKRPDRDGAETPRYVVTNTADGARVRVGEK